MVMNAVGLGWFAVCAQPSIVPGSDVWTMPQSAASHTSNLLSLLLRQIGLPVIPLWLGIMDFLGTILGPHGKESGVSIAPYITNELVKESDIE